MINENRAMTLAFLAAILIAGEGTVQRTNRKLTPTDAVNRAEELLLAAEEKVASEGKSPVGLTTKQQKGDTAFKFLSK